MYFLMLYKCIISEKVTTKQSYKQSKQEDLAISPASLDSHIQMYLTSMYQHLGNLVFLYPTLKKKVETKSSHCK